MVSVKFENKKPEGNEIMLISEHNKKVSIQVTDYTTWQFPVFHFTDLEQLDKFIAHLQEIREEVTK